MNVMMISRAPVVGGAELSLLECASQLVKLPDIAVHIVAPENSEVHDVANKKHLSSRQYRAVSLEGKRSILAQIKLPFSLIREVYFFLKLYSMQQVDIVHINGLKAALSSIVAAKLSRIPTVLHIRDYPKHPRVLRFITRLANLVVAPSNFIGDSVLKVTSIERKKVLIIPNGIEQSASSIVKQKNIRQSINVETISFLIVMIAQLAPWKRHDLLLEAVAILNRKGLDVHIVIAGNDLWGLNADYEQSLILRAQQDDLIGHVTFLGLRDDITDLLQASDLMVLPSQNEPFGRVVLEAWQAGTPVIASDQGGPAELIEDKITGLHFKNGDFKSLADTIEHLIQTPDLSKKLSEAGLKEVQQYTVEAHASIIAQSYRDILPCA